MRWLLRLYPRAWRQRYGEEMLALLEQHNITLATILDLLLGALDAHLFRRSVTEGVALLVNRLRTNVIVSFAAFMVFGVGWGMLQRIPDPADSFARAANAHPELAVLTAALFVVGCLAFAVFLLGGVPLVAVSVRRLSLALAIALVVLIYAHAPQLFTTQDVDIRMSVAGIALMSVGTVLAALALRRERRIQLEAN